MKNNRKNSIRKAHAPVPTTRVSHHFLQYSILHQCIKKYKSDIQKKNQNALFREHTVLEK